MPSRAYPYYAQSTEFSCGPACALMALASFGKTTKLSRDLEFEVWRETNAIGVKGANPWGLALPLARRGLVPRILSEGQGTFPAARIAAFAGKDMVKLVEWAERSQREEARRLGVPTLYRAPTLADYAQALAQGETPISLVYAHSAPHWVLVTHMDEKTVTYNDPYRQGGGPRRRVTHARFKRMMDALKERDYKRGAVIVGTGAVKAGVPQ